MRKEKHILVPPRIRGRHFAVGQTIRKYQSWFCHNDALAGWYTEGQVERIEHFMGEVYRIWYRIDKVVSNGRELPQSWMVGKLGDCCSDSGFVQLIDPNPQLVFTQSQPLYQ